MDPYQPKHHQHIFSEKLFLISVEFDPLQVPLRHRTKRINVGKEGQGDHGNKHQINHGRFNLEKDVVVEEIGQAGEKKQKKRIEQYKPL